MSFFDTDVIISVFNPWTGLVIPGASVVIFDLSTSDSIVGITDNAGLFSTTVFPGQYALMVAKTGFYEHSEIIGVGGEFLQIPVALTPTSGEPPPDPPIVTDLRVKVVDETGQSIQGASVSVGSSLTGITSSIGVVFFADIAIAVFGWVVSKTGFHDSTGTVDTNKITDLTVTLIEVSQPPPPPIIEHTITVLVKDERNLPVPNAQVRVNRIEGGFDSAQATNSSGKVVFNRTPTGNYRAQVISAGQTDFDIKEFFVDRNVTVTLSAPIQWRLTILAGTGGTTNPAPGVFFFEDGETTSVLAIPNNKYEFRKFEVNGNERLDNPKSLTMSKDRIIEAFFSFIGDGNGNGQDPGTVPVDWDVPAEAVSGVYDWSLKFNIIAIPFVSAWIAQIITATGDDEARLNQMMVEQGAEGTATILSKELTTRTNFFGAVDQFMIKYKVAFSGSLRPSARVRVTLFPWAILIPFIPQILGIIALIVIGLIVTNITSTVRKILGPQSYTPSVPGECADGWVYDAEKGICKKGGLNLGLVAIGLTGLFVLSQQRKNP